MEDTNNNDSRNQEDIYILIGVDYAKVEDKTVLYNPVTKEYAII